MSATAEADLHASVHPRPDRKLLGLDQAFETEGIVHLEDPNKDPKEWASVTLTREIGGPLNLVHLIWGNNTDHEDTVYEDMLESSPTYPGYVPDETVLSAHIQKRITAPDETYRPIARKLTHLMRTREPTTHVIWTRNAPTGPTVRAALTASGLGICNFIDSTRGLTGVSSADIASPSLAKLDLLLDPPDTWGITICHALLQTDRPWLAMVIEHQPMGASEQTEQIVTIFNLSTGGTVPLTRISSKRDTVGGVSEEYVVDCSKLQVRASTWPVLEQETELPPLARLVAEDGGIGHRAGPDDEVLASHIQNLYRNYNGRYLPHWQRRPPNSETLISVSPLLRDEEDAQGGTQVGTFDEDANLHVERLRSSAESRVR